MQLTTEFQKVLETSTKVTQNVTGYLRLYLKYGGRDETNNKDIIYYEIRQYAYNPYGNYLAWEWTSDLAWNIKLGTTTKASGTYKQTPAIYSDGKERVRVSGSWEQEHNPDGTWSSSISVEGYVYQTKVSASGNIELPTIPRKTTIDATDAKIGSISTIYLTINSTSFNHQLLWRYPNEDVWSVIASNVKGNYQWKVPDEIYEAIPNDKSIELIILCDTYNTNGSLVGSDETTMWASVNEEVARPTFNVTIKNDGTSGTTYKLTGSENAFIKDYTNAIIDANAVARKSATLQEYRVVNGNKSSTAQDTTINAISTGKFSFFVKDSRQLSPSTGYQTDKYVDTFIEYFAPKVLTPTIERTEQTSTEIVATLSGTYWNGNFGAVTNVGTLQYSWRSKLAGSNEWGEWSSWATPTISGSNFYINNLSLGDIYATNSSYDFQFRFIDALSNLDPTKIVTTATQNVTISTPVVEIYEDAVNINGNITMNNSLLPYISQNVPTITNCNDLELKSGFYWANGTATGVPSTSNAWYIQQIRATGYITQIAYKIGSDGIYYRTYGFDSGGWYAWTPMIFGRNLAQSYTERDDIPYSARYVNNLNVYSSDETKVGTWFGKPLYRKVVTTNELLSGNSTIEVLHNIENIDISWIDNANSFFRTNSGLSYSLPMIGYNGNTTDKTYAYVEGANIKLFSNGSWGTGWQKVITLLYTKTTD